MWRAIGILLGYGVGVGAATWVGTDVLAVHGTLRPLEAAIIGAVVAGSKDGMNALLDSVQTWWEYRQVRNVLHALHGDLSGGPDRKNTRLVPCDKIKLTTNRLLARHPRDVDRSVALIQLGRDLDGCLADLKTETTRFCDLTPDMITKLNKSLLELKIGNGAHP